MKGTTSTRSGASGSAGDLERTLFIVKPDGVRRLLIGEILSRFEAKGLRIAALKMMRIPPALAEKNYAVHRDKPFYGDLVGFMTSGPCVLGVLEGPGAIAAVRKLLGATFGREAEPGTIRGDLALDRQNNLIHGSDSPESATREIGVFFRPSEFQTFDGSPAAW